MSPPEWNRVFHFAALALIIVALLLCSACTADAPLPATVSVNDGTLANEASDEAASNDVWQQAQRRGVTFRAIGQEPGWLLEITSGREILLVTDYGQERSSFPYVGPVVHPAEQRTEFVLAGESTIVEIRAEPCRDTMSGEAFALSVTIRLPDRRLQGCGRALGSDVAWAAPEAVGTSASTGGESMRYRGNYTFGHEVNVFCPAISSQCYWLSGDTPGELRAALRRLAEAMTSEPYEPVCVVIEAAIDRDATRDGFARDYDGLITISRIYGRCAETGILTPGDLQHHRWVLDTINSEPVPSAGPGERVPELEFGEGMRVTGNSGCNGFSGTGVLRDEFFVVEAFLTTAMACGRSRNELELIVQTVLGSESRISQDPDRALTLDSPAAVLSFRLQDRVD